MAVVWPKLSDFLPAIADLVALSTATTAGPSFAVVSSVVSGSWRDQRNGLEPLILVWISFFFSSTEGLYSIFSRTFFSRR